MIAGDFETTGLLKPDLCELHLQPFITELYFCKFDWNGKIISEIETYLKPPVPIPDNIVEITGITNEMVADAPTFIEIYDDLCDFFLGEKTFFAHNASYEIGILSCELQRKDLELKFPWPPNQICTVETSFPIQNKRMALGDLYYLATGKKMFNAHRAKADVMALVEVAIWLKEKGFINEKHC